MSLKERFASAWNAFRNRADPNKWEDWSFDTQPVSYSYRPDRPAFTNGRDRSIITAILTRIAVDCAQNPFNHVKVDEDGFFIEKVKDELNECLTTEANIDQTGKAFILDIVVSLLDEGSVAVVPIDTDRSSINYDIFTIYTMRVGKILEWYPNAVKVEVYDEFLGRKRPIIVPKATTAIIENPFYSIMNEPNSIAQRLNQKLNLLDVVDQQNSSGKLDLIIQLPYVVKGEQRKKQAEERRSEIERQLTGSKYGIAYTDGTEKITQLNRPVENQLLTEVDSLKQTLYSQLGISEDILKGSAKPEELNNYYVHTLEPIMDAIAEEFTRKFLSKTARTQGHAIRYFRSLFKILPLTTLADLIDKFTRNEILTANEIRQILGVKPSSDPGADDLRNKNNLATPSYDGTLEGEQPVEEGMTEDEYNEQMGAIEENEKQLQDLEKSLAQSEEGRKVYYASHERQ